MRDVHQLEIDDEEFEGDLPRVAEHPLRVEDGLVHEACSNNSARRSGRVAHEDEEVKRLVEGLGC